MRQGSLLFGRGPAGWSQSVLPGFRFGACGLGLKVYRVEVSRFGVLSLGLRKVAVWVWCLMFGLSGLGLRIRQGMR